MEHLAYIFYLTRTAARELDFPAPPLSRQALARIKRAAARVRKVLRGQVSPLGMGAREALTDDEVRAVAANVRDDVDAWRAAHPVSMLGRRSPAEQAAQEMVVLKDLVMSSLVIGTCNGDGTMTLLRYAH